MGRKKNLWQKIVIMTKMNIIESIKYYTVKDDKTSRNFRNVDCRI